MAEARDGGDIVGGGGLTAIAAARVERLISAIAIASTVSIEEALLLLGAGEHDAFGIVEEGFAMFLTELRDAKAATSRALQEVEQKLQTIEEQRSEIEELSAPIIDVWDSVLALPLVGRIDRERASRITEALLHRVVAARTRWVIVDLTGVSGVDETTAGSLVQLTTAAELIGARCMVTGIRPAIVEALMAHDVQTGRLHPRRTLQEGLLHCMQDLRASGHTRRPG